MKDPRLAEIEFLSTVERNDGNKRLSVTTHGNKDHYGLPAAAFKQLLFDLIEEGCLNGAASLLNSPRPLRSVHLDWVAADDPAELVQLDRKESLARLFEEQELVVVLGHKGRLRLWRLRDEVHARRRREDLGVLWAKSHYLDDLGVALAMRTSSTPVSVLRFDLDKFKQVNDQLGHAEGDEVLKRFMQIVREAVATVDEGEAYRVGGDEVAAIIPAIGHARAMQLAESIRAQVAAAFKDAQSKPTPTTSIGVVTFKTESTPADADRRADELVYASKKAGCDRVTGDER